MGNQRDVALLMGALFPAIISLIRLTDAIVGLVSRYKIFTEGQSSILLAELERRTRNAAKYMKNKDMIRKMTDEELDALLDLDRRP
jgi:hypothetical protein